MTVLWSSLRLTVKLVLNLHGPDIPTQHSATAHCLYRKMKCTLLECISHSAATLSILITCAAYHASATFVTAAVSIFLLLILLQYDANNCKSCVVFRHKNKEKRAGLIISPESYIINSYMRFQFLKAE